MEEKSRASHDLSDSESHDPLLLLALLALRSGRVELGVDLVSLSLLLSLVVVVPYSLLGLLGSLFDLIVDFVAG